MRNKNTIVLFLIFTLYSCGYPKYECKKGMFYCRVIPKISRNIFNSETYNNVYKTKFSYSIKQTKPLGELRTYIDSTEKHLKVSNYNDYMIENHSISYFECYPEKEYCVLVDYCGTQLILLPSTVQGFDHTKGDFICDTLGYSIWKLDSAA